MTGARSVSDLARSAVQKMIDETAAGSTDGVNTKLAELETTVANLGHRINQLTMVLSLHLSRNANADEYKSALLHNDFES